MITKLAREPLLHFLVAGALLFSLYHALHGSGVAAEGDGRAIVVDRQALLSYMQYESMAFRPDVFEERLAAMTPVEKRELVDDYVREEALVREARLIGLDGGDYVIRRRMAQKVLYLIDDAATASFSPTDETLRSYFHKHEERYRIAPTLTFTHVFIDKTALNPEPPLKRARRVKQTLESAKARFENAPAYGDGFPYLRNCVKRAPDFIESQFGETFTRELVKLQPSQSWQGPIESDYGYHLVLLTTREPAHLPSFEDVKEQVRGELLRDTLAAHREAAIKDLVGRFEVTVNDAEISLADTKAGREPPRVARTSSQ